MKKTLIHTAFISAILSAQGFAETVDSEVLWQFCPTDLGIPLPPEPQPGLEAGATSLAADEAQMVDSGVSTLTGDVEIIRDSQTLAAQQVDYDNQQDLIIASTDVHYWGSSIYWSGEKTRVDMTNKTATFENGNYQLLDRRGHGEAGKIHDDQLSSITTLENFSYTTCPPETNTWELKGEDMELDHNREIGTAKHLRLYLKDMPVFYFPYISFPLSDKRKSGFLPPSFGNSSDSGFDLTVPYYWNIAASQDATLAPRHISDRGTMMVGEYRWLLEQGHGQVGAEILANDEARGDITRHLLNLNLQQGVGQRGNFYVDYNHVSDKEYFEDLGNSLSVSSTRFLTQSGVFTYSGQRWSMYSALHNYQNVDPSLSGASTPYKRLPQFIFSASPFDGGNRHLNFNFQAETVYFDREDSVIGGRIKLQPTLSYPIRSSGSFIVPSLNLNHTQYLLDNTAAGIENQQSRTIPTFSVDSGLYLERQLKFGDSSFLHTLEPRVYYLYVPHEGQDDIPVFDSGEYDISFAQLFRPNRFSGNDRIGDANQLSIALTTRLLDQSTGLERLRASIGQIYHFRDRQVGLTPQQAVNEDNSSEIVTEVAGRITRNWSSGATLQWNPNNNRTDKSAVHLRYRRDDRRLFNLSYRFNNELVDIEQTDLSMRWPLGRNWSAIGRWNFSIPDNETLETVAGLEYNSCCWGVRTVIRRHLSTTGGAYDNSFFIQFVLKGLAGLGQSTSSFLQQSVPGYKPEF